MITKLINLANHLDQRGLRKEADLLDEMMSKYAFGGDHDHIARISREHPARQWVVVNINKKSKLKEDKEGFPRPINLFKYARSQDYVITPGVINDDDGLLIVFANQGSGNPEEQIQELEDMFTGISSGAEVILKDIGIESGNIYSLRYDKLRENLILIYDLLL
jgi:hypothetical protein